MTEMFLRLDGIDGESLDEEQTNQIEIMDFKWGVAHEGDRSKEDSDPSKISPTFTVITINKIFDKASPNLLRFFTKGTEIAEGTVTFRKLAGGEKVRYLIIKLEKIRITAFDWNHEGQDGVVHEEIHLDVGGFFATYTRQANSGNVAGFLDFGFDILAADGTKANKEKAFGHSKEVKITRQWDLF